MARPTKRSGSSNHQFRKRVPADVLLAARGKRIAFALPKARAGDECIYVSATFGAEVLVSLRTEDNALAKLRHTAAATQFERAIAAFREGPRALTNKDHVKLAGILYRDLASGFEDEPVSAAWWEIVADVAQRVLTPAPGPSLMIEAYPGEAQLFELERYVGPFLDAILIREGVIPTGEDRPKLLRAFAKALIDAANKLKRNADGDYAPDDAVAARYPQWDGIGTKALPKPSTLTFEDLLTRWKAEDTRSASSIGAFSKAVADFTAHLKHSDPRLVVKSDVVHWAMALRERSLSPKTINDTYLAAIRALYNLALRSDLVTINPVEGYRIPSKRRAGEKMLAYDDNEVATILALADKETSAALRWVPWLLALTGARVGEIAQLWARRVVEKDGITVLRFTPAEDGGSLKNDSSERDVPVHPELVARGFLTFVKTLKRQTMAAR